MTRPSTTASASRAGETRPHALRAVRAPHGRTEARKGSGRRLAVGLGAIALGLATVAVLGPLVTGLIDYRVTATLRSQTIGLDAASVFVVVPLALLAASLVARGHLVGLMLAPAIGAYASYMMLQYVLGPDYTSLPGNNERLFPLALLLFAAGWLVALASWRATGSQELPGAGYPNRRLAVVLALLAFLTFVRYLPALADWTSGAPEDGVYLAGPGFAWAIALLDLGVALPVTVAACIGLARGAPWAEKLAYAVVGWFGLVGSAVAAMALVMYANGDPNASAGDTIFLIALGAAFVLLAVAAFGSLASRLHGR